MDAAGVDDTAKVYDTPGELWKEIKSSNKESTSLPDWYSTAVNYWDKQPATVDGVLGGYGHTSDPDLQDSKKFLLKAYGSHIEKHKKDELVAVDCGAGVGRVTEGLLLHFFQQVDLVEPSAHLLQAAKQNFSSPSKSQSSSYPPSHKVVNYIQTGLESFIPPPGRYDIIWVQWAMLYLTDDDAISFLNRCSAALKPGGMVFIKENVCDEGFIVDREDASVTRSHKYYIELIEKAGMGLVHTALQKNFPKELFKVRMYAAKPKM